MENRLFAAVGAVVIGALCTLGLYVILYGLYGTYIGLSIEDIKPEIKCTSIIEASQLWKRS